MKLGLFLETGWLTWTFARNAYGNFEFNVEPTAPSLELNE